MRPLTPTTRGLRASVALAFVTILTLSSAMAGQESSGSRVPSVSMSPAAIPTIVQGGVGKVELQFHITPGFHINSNTPSEEYLIPTSLNMDAPTDIVVGRISYPRGQEITLPFAPDQKLSVYSGEFTLFVTIRPLSSVIHGKYALHGRLKYQACDKAACYPPKNLPVAFEVRIAKSPSPRRRNPAQSPNVH
jgi:Thiol:disulfide interchange protein DsbD, N-terminal